MIYTVTLNPALDKYLTIDTEVKAGAKNFVKVVRRDVGGKGLNVTKVTKSIEGKSVACAILGGTVGRTIETKLLEKNFNLIAVYSEQSTRTNSIITDPDGRRTMLSEAGPKFEAEQTAELKLRLTNIINSGDILVLAGSPPQGAPKSLYADWITYFSAKGVKVFTDPSGKFIEETAAAKPYFIKCNHMELGIEPTFEAGDEAAKALIDKGVTKVVVALADQGAVYRDSTGKCLKCPALDVPIVSVTGAGDAMIAGFVAAEENGRTAEDSMRFAMAVASAKIMTEGTKAPSFSLIKELRPKVEFI
ncbi:MAG: hexose kinase [Clostridiales bacterium]|nr:hexose kinase [Clostridiales bacterium]